MKRALLALVIFFHVGGGWALTQVEPVKLMVGDIAPMEVRMVPAEQAAQPDPPLDEPPPLPEVKPPPPELATIVDPPPPDLPPPEFPIAKIDIRRRRTAAAGHAGREAAEAQAGAAQAGAEAAADAAARRSTRSRSSAAPAAPAAPKTMSASQLGYLVPPNRSIRRARARRASRAGSWCACWSTSPAGRRRSRCRPRRAIPALDESALSAVRAAQFRPYAEGGRAKAVWVLVPINFVLAVGE